MRNLKRYYDNQVMNRTARTAKMLVQDCCSTHTKSPLSLREKKVKTQALGETIPTWEKKNPKKLGYF
jgi:hypothetical protein